MDRLHHRRSRDSVRALFLADTHLGFDMPLRPRVEKRRRGPDFFRVFDYALETGLREKVDFVLHGGDLFHRSRVSQGIVSRAIESIEKIAAAGIPFFIVPGNHERSALPSPLFWSIPNVHIFLAPETFRFTSAGKKIALSGFPFHRRDVCRSFARLLSETNWGEEESDLRLLCMHQTVEGAVVGPTDYTFRGGPDVIPGRMIPRGFAAILSGHIHRMQVLGRGGGRERRSTPVLYPGSTERTSFAEMGEDKGFLLVEFEPDRRSGGRLVRSIFRETPARPMTSIDSDFSGRIPARHSTTFSRQSARQAEPNTPIPPLIPPFSSGWSR